MRYHAPEPPFGAPRRLEAAGSMFDHNGAIWSQSGSSQTTARIACTVVRSSSDGTLGILSDKEGTGFPS
jgi:hypothetical protein